MTRTLLILVSTVALSAANALAAPPKADPGSPTFTSTLGADHTLKLFADAGERDVMLHNNGSEPVTVQDVVSVSTLTLRPGARIGLSCDTKRHLSISMGDAVVYESAGCGSLLKVATEQRGQKSGQALAKSEALSQVRLASMDGMTDVALEGTATISIIGDQVSIDVDRVVNNSSNTTSGTLHLQVWLTTSSSAAGSGYEIADFIIGELSPGSYFSNISDSQTMSDTPPEGTYYVHLLLTEYPNVDTIIDSISMSEQYTYSGDSGGGSTDDLDDLDDAIGGGALHPLFLLMMLGFIGLASRRRND